MPIIEIISWILISISILCIATTFIHWVYKRDTTQLGYRFLVAGCFVNLIAAILGVWR